jgi:tetratricopeptide (TPR) repeat protein
VSEETPLASEAPPLTREASLEPWERAGLAALAVIVLAVPLSLLRPPRAASGPGLAGTAPAFVGSASCEECHQAAFRKWRGSHHERAMDVASEKTVLGDFADAMFTNRGVTSRFYRRGGKFYVHTEGPDGKPGEFEIAYTFGVKPLQQYLVPFPGGRLQCLTVAWDTERKRWFQLYPDQDIPPSDWLHWTRNAQNWNGMCAECHSTNLKKGYDPETETYKTTWSEISVGCEACHGAGSRHVAWARIPAMARPALADQGLVVPTSGITSTQLVELCAPCHSRRAELGDYDHGGRLLMDQMLPSLLTEGLYFADGQQQDEVYTYASFLQSKMYARGVKCNDCHDSHSIKLKLEGNEVCLQCHVREVFDSAEHHFHKKVVDGKPSEGALCARCHMPKRAYMVVDPRSDHSFRRPRPDLTAEIGTPNACTQSGCHADKPLSYSLNAYRKWYGLARRPHFGTTFAAARAGKPEAAEELLRLVDNPLQPAIVRATALSLLQGYPGEASTGALRRSLLSDDPLLRHVAASGLTVPDPRARVSLLAPLLSDPVKAVRLDTLSALAGVPRELLKPYQQEAFDEALAEYREAMAYSLDFSSSGLNLGNLYANLGQPVEAEKYFRIALKIDDLFFPAKMNLAVLLSGQGRGAEAEKLLREVVAAYPDNGDARYALGLQLVELGKAGEAVEQLRRAVDLLPGNARARYNLGLLLAQRGHHEEAGTLLAGALALEPQNPDFLLALADHWLRHGRPREALALAERLIAARPGEPAGRQLRALAEQAIAGGPSRSSSSRAPR